MIDNDPNLTLAMHRLLNVAFLGILAGHATGSTLLFVFSAVAMVVPCVWIEVNS